ncbi:hypothetical protein J2855_001793 [Agrobacterium tumefaciens]|uniref:hypothetical protein n=1 Tax=Agrobacterium tumefaciens TaxID=358 RepID=UPI001AE62FB5|nr:hypothetical protein [Agrobacterium tumefaciens]MBP2508158.1 hypothetical protein [Agrobacterium tumefaciens]MBP2517310.1 hypothetical protein [Agrobacterium tumefaciens]MBP2575944.1 hypothetical protein [Agrobacterium tumefaciens]MBP2594300.1 hypothetical protein [Agrobacterium tumefaciens]
MADRPILFSTPMVRALLDGRKTQTRRELKPQPRLMSDKGLSYIGTDGKGHQPRISVGDRLYVREHWRTSGSLDSRAPRDLPRTAAILCNADEFKPVWAGKHRQAMHMPRWASRLTLTVTDVRVERLQDISHEDALAEGIVQLDRKAWIGGGPLYGLHQGEGHDTATGAYNRLWRDINGDGSWAANPWIVVYTFTVHHGNIDQIAQVAA